MGGVRRFAVWMFLLASLESAACQVVVEGFVGEDAVLPCIYSDAAVLPDEVSIFWRDQDGGIVLDIVRSSENRTSQNEKFSGRVFSFPNEYKKGNFSVVMRRLQRMDSGLYECHVQRLYFRNKVTLTVSGERDVGASMPLSPGGAAVTTSLHPAVLSAPLSLLLCCIIGFN